MGVCGCGSWREGNEEEVEAEVGEEMMEGEADKVDRAAAAEVPTSSSSSSFSASASASVAAPRREAAGFFFGDVSFVTGRKGSWRSE